MAIITTANIPTYYHLIFTWIDPIVCFFSGTLVYLFTPGAVVDTFSPGAVARPDHVPFYHRMAGEYAALAFLFAVGLRSTTDIKVWKVIQFATVIIDVGELVSMYLVMRNEGRLDLSGWRGADWFCWILTSWALLGRLAFLGNVGFASASGRKVAKLP